MIYTVDRIEEGRIAVLEDSQGRMSDWPLAGLPEGLREGDRLEQGPEGWRRLSDRESRLAGNRALLDRLRRRRD